MLDKSEKMWYTNLAVTETDKIVHWKINSAEFLSVEKSTKNYEFFMTEIRKRNKVSGTLKVQS